MKTVATLLAAGLLSLGTMPALVQAQTASAGFPAKPIRFVIGFPPGGTSDAYVRDIATELGKSMGQPVLVENRPGAGGNVAGDHVAKSDPDGHTLLFATSSLAVSTAIYSKLAFDPVKDLKPVSLVALVPNLMAISPKVDAKNVKEFVALAKRKPGQIAYASAGNGSFAHLSGAFFANVTGTELMHVPYKGNSPATADLVSGIVHANFNQISFVMPLVKEGRLKALAIASAERSPLMPDVPTVVEQGYPEFVMEPWFGVLTPAATPAPIVEQLSAVIARVVKSPEMTARWARQGGKAIGSTPAEFERFYREDIAKMQAIAKTAGAKVD